MPVLFPSQPRHLSSAVVLAALAMAGPAVPSASAASPEAQASASASLQVQAQASTDAAARLARRSQTAAVRALATTRERLRRAQTLTVSAVAGGEATVAADAGARFTASFAGQSADLVRLVRRTEGRVESAAAATARELARLDAEVTAALASRADVGADAEVTTAVATTDAGHVRVIASLAAALRGPDLAGRTRAAMEQAAGAVIVLRGAVATRLLGLRTAVTGAVQPVLTSAIDATTNGSAAVAAEIDQVLDPGLSVEGGASVQVGAGVSAGLPGVSLVAEVLARLGGQRAAVRAALRGRA